MPATDSDNTDFLVDLYRRLASERGNIFFSPYSISTALAMTAAGARGPTEQEMAAALHLSGDAARRNADAGKMIKSINDANSGLFNNLSAGLELSTVNALWCAKQIQFHKEFLAVAKRDFRAEVRALDFAGKPDEALKTINDWVAEATSDRIKDLLTRDAIRPNSALVLTNAIYMKANWVRPFKKEATHDADFMLADGSKIQVHTMSQVNRFGYVTFGDFAAIDMPYQGDRLSMLILLPKEVDGLPKLEKLFTAERVRETVQKLEVQQVTVHLPKWHAETTYELSGHLQAIGMKLAFGDKADFTGITTDDPLFISLVAHKAFVDVDELGTEAAAATAVSMLAGSARPREPIVFRADHPFIYLIRDSETGQVLFAGRMADPRK